MMVLIDRKELERQIKEAFRESPATMGMLLRWVRKQKTVDAVPVVRCKECKFYGFTHPEKASPWGVCKKHIFYKATDADDFCKYGERRADNGEEQ